MPKRVVLFQINRIDISEKEINTVVDVIKSKRDKFEFIDIRGNNFHNAAEAKEALRCALTSKIDLMIAHLSDWEAFWDTNPAETHDRIMIPIDCVMFTTQDNQPSKKASVQLFLGPIHYLSRDDLASYVDDILTKGSSVIDELDGTEKTIVELINTLSPYCILRSDENLQQLIGNNDRIKKNWEAAISKIQKGMVANASAPTHLLSLNPKELILEFRGYL